MSSHEADLRRFWTNIDFIFPRHSLIRKTKSLKGEKESLEKGAYEANIVLDRENILNLKLMSRCHDEVYRLLR